MHFIATHHLFLSTMLYGVQSTEHTVQSCVREVIGTFRKAGEKRLGAHSTYIGSANKDSGWLNRPPLFPPL